MRSRKCQGTAMKKIILFIAALSLVSCHARMDRAAIEAEIRSVIEQQRNGWNAGSVKGYMSGYWQSDSLRFASGGKVSYGWQTTFERFQKGYPDRAAMGMLIFSDIDIQVLSPDAAFVFGKWELERNNDHPWGLFTLIFRKTGDGWHIVHDHTSAAE